MKNNFSKLIVFILFIIWLWTFFNLKLWRNERLIEGDVFSYYAYLPALFIKQDIKLSFLDYDKASYFNNMWYSTTPEGVRFSKMGVGMALLYAPFFFVAHVIAVFSENPADGFSTPYRILLILSSIFYALAGIVFLRKTMLRFFSDIITGIVLLCIVLGTNLLAYTTLSPLMSHAYGFFLFSVLIYLTVLWHEKPTIINSVLLGIAGGLIIITRPSNIIILLIPLLYKIENIKNSGVKFSFLFQNIKYVLLIPVFAFLITTPQLIYWKIISGQWIYYSYTDEHFFFQNPHIIEGLFGFRKGWLLYTPIMTLAIAGLFFLKRKAPHFFLPTIIFLPFNIYIIFSWWCWWYGGGFSARPMIESYALMALPLASFLSFIMNKKFITKAATGVVVFFFISLNCFQTYQFKSSLLHYDSMTKEAYRAIFGKIKFPENYSQLIKEPDYDSAKKKGTENLISQ